MAAADPAGAGRRESTQVVLRFRGERSNPNHAAVVHLLRVYAGHLGARLEEVTEGPSEIAWGPPAGDQAPGLGSSEVAEFLLSVPARPHAEPDLAFARTRQGYPVPAAGLRRGTGEALDAAGDWALRREGSALALDWDLLSFCADILFRRADFLPERAVAAREALGRGQWDEAAGLDEAPWVDRWMFRLLAALPALAPALAALPGRAAVWLTHDLDNLAKWRARSVAGQLLRTPLQLAAGRFALAARNWGEIAVRLAEGKDPFDTLDAVLALEQAHGRKSANFFLATGRDHLFHRYDLARPRFRRVLEACRDAGMDVGLHGQVHFIRDPEGMRAEKARMEGLLGGPVVLNRQHYLRWDPAETFPALAAAGIRADSTLGYNDMPGFRTGTALPYRWFDCAAGKPLDLLVIPLVIGEFQFYDPQGFDGAEVRKTLRRYLDVTREGGGVFTALFHNEYFHEAQFPGHAAVYRDLLGWIGELGLPDFDPAAALRAWADTHG